MIASGSPFDTPGSVVAYKRLATYPVYVAIGRTKASILQRMARIRRPATPLIAIPAVLGFILLNLVALRRTQREQTALAQARDAIAQRAALEAQLHQAQKVEAVALLTAGIAHDFNNLLTIVAANIALLEQQLDNLSPRQQKFIASANSACERAAVLTTPPAELCPPRTGRPAAGRRQSDHFRSDRPALAFARRPDRVDARGLPRICGRYSSIPSSSRTRSSTWR